MNRAAMKAMRSVRMSVVVMVAVFGVIDEVRAVEDPTLEWTVSVGGEDNHIKTWPPASSVDQNGNTYVAGDFFGRVDFDPGPEEYYLTSTTSKYSDAYVMKLSPIGDLIWAKAITGDRRIAAWSMHTDNVGNVYVAGSYSGRTDFDPGPDTFYLNTEYLGYDKWSKEHRYRIQPFVMKLTTDGDFLWAKAIDGTGSKNLLNSGSIFSMDIDGDDNVYLTGEFTGNVDFDPGPGTHYLFGTPSAYVLKLDSTGEFVWAKAFIGGTTTGYSVAVDNMGFVHVAGTFSYGPVDFDPGPDTFYLTRETGHKSVFIAKLDHDGEFVWAGSVGSVNDHTDTRSLSVDENGNTYVTGHFYGKTDFDPGPETYYLTPKCDHNHQQLFVMKLDPTGKLEWAKSIGEEDGKGEGQIGFSIVADGKGNVLVTGKLSGRVDYDPGPDTYYLTSVNRSDPFIMNLNSDGELMWATVITGASRKYNYNSGQAIEVDDDYNVYVAGVSSEDVFVSKLSFTPPNGLPEFNVATEVAVAEGTELVISGFVSDPDGDDISITATPNPAGLTVDGTTLTWTPDYDQAGVYEIELTADDGNGGTATATITITVENTVLNAPPVFNQVALDGFKEGTETSIGNLATDPDGDDITITFTAASPYPTGLMINGTTLTWTPDYDQADVYEIELTADDGNGGIATATLTITVENTNRPPVANAGADIAAECAGVPTTAQLDGSGSSDPDGDEITYAWSADGIEFDDATAAIPTGEFPLGETTVTLTVSDGEPLDGTDTDEAVVTIVDTAPPTINYTQIATELWPPNHNMAPAIEGISATDACGGDIVLDVTVTSDEDGMGGAGNTEEDWDIITVDDGSQSVALRAERSGNGDGREYTVVVTATDASGNSTEQTLTVAVPLSKGNVSDNGNGKGKGRGKEVATPLTTALYDNYPNPFNAETVIRFDVAESGPVRLDIFDITGRRIRTLVDQFYSAGSIELAWDSRDNAGNEVASGVYVYRLQTAENSFSKRLMLLR